MSPRRTYARIFLDRIQENYRAMRRVAGEAVEVLCVLKADAYGHGAVPVSAALAEIGARFFAVACLEEAIELRRAGLEGKILLLNGVEEGDEACARAQRLTPVIHSREQLERWQGEAASCGRKLGFHVDLNTGMNRMGFAAETAGEVAWLAAKLSECRELELLGISTHLASAEDFESAQTEQQCRRFREALQAFREQGLAPALIHVANSAAIAYRPQTHETMIRPGAALFGYLLPPRGTPTVSGPRLQPALEWNARVLAVREVSTGARLGYNGAYLAPAPMRIATIGVGYADGYARSLSNRGEVLFGGRRCPVVGLVSMDLTLIDASSTPGLAPGDEVTLLGEGLDALDLSRYSGDLLHETLCRISRRVPRVYEQAGVKPPIESP